MLKKLFKYEWVFFWKVPTAINVFLIIVTIVGVISLASPFWELNLWGIDVLLGLAIFFYIMAIFACSIAVTVYVAVRYYKNIYTDEGYLTNGKADRTLQTFYRPYMDSAHRHSRKHQRTFSGVYRFLCFRLRFLGRCYAGLSGFSGDIP